MLHASRYLQAHAWVNNGSPDRVQFRIGITRYSATAEETREFARQLLAAADEAERHGRA